MADKSFDVPINVFLVNNYTKIVFHNVYIEILRFYHIPLLNVSSNSYHILNRNTFDHTYLDSIQILWAAYLHHL